jgi:hypothetical protein
MDSQAPFESPIKSPSQAPNGKMMQNDQIHLLILRAIFSNVLRLISFSCLFQV